jgi:Holliday junction DNA helicase RuvA
MEGKMFSYFNGKVIKKYKERLILDVNNIGFDINMSETDLAKIDEGQIVQLFAYTDIKEGYIGIFGFLSEESQSVFEKLKKVSGIGSKTALAVLSYMSPSEVCLAIANEDSAVISKIPGIGAKTAARIILELKDKILKDGVVSIDKTKSTKAKSNAAENEAILALKVLGYSTSQITEALSEVDTVDKTVEQIIKSVLNAIKK